MLWQEPFEFADGLCRQSREDVLEISIRIRRALLRRDGGDRVMAQVLSAVPVFGLEAVLVAVDLALESGRPRAEHVLNVLARLREGPPPPSVETGMAVTVAPIADAWRYDSLREEVSHD